MNRQLVTVVSVSAVYAYSAKRLLDACASVGVQKISQHRDGAAQGFQRLVAGG